MTRILSSRNAKYLAIAVLDVIAALPLALILAFLSAQLVFNFYPASSEVPASSAVVIVVVLMFVLTIVIRVRPLLVVGAIPLAFLLAGYPVSRNQLFVAAAAFAGFIIVVRLIHRLATPALALVAVFLTYGLYLFPLLQPLFIAHTTAVIAWFVGLLLCWTLLSIPVGLVGKAFVAEKVEVAQPEATEAPPVPVQEKVDPLQQQIAERLKRLQADQDMAVKER
jgi:hypothetical protein